MNHSYLAASLTPTATPTPTSPPTPQPPLPPLPRPLSTAAVIPLDYSYQTMAPSALRPQVDVDLDLEPPYSSLFGDPVPPPPPADFFATHFQPFRATSTEFSSPEQEGDLFGQTVTLTPAARRPPPTRLFSDVPYSSSLSHRRLPAGFDVLPTPMPRCLEPPDIQILPNTNSSGGSSSEARDSPNFALLTPDQIGRRAAPNEAGTDVAELVETMTISDASGRREYSEATRRVSNFSADFKSHVGSLSPCGVVAPPAASFTRQLSNESYSSSEWFRPVTHNFPEFSKIPRLRPSSKNVMSIKRDEMPVEQSPVAKLIHDSNGSSSGEERRMDTTQTLDQPTVPLEVLQNAPERPPDPSPTCLLDMEADRLLQQEFEKARRKSSTSDSLGPNYPSQPKQAPPVPPAPPTLEEMEELPKRRDVSPVILRDSVATGGDFRVDHLRLHKKASFSIICDRTTPQSSRPVSPAHHTPRLPTAKDHATTSSSSLGKPIAKPRHHLQRKSLSSTQLKLPQVSLHAMPADDSPRPSVQFNMTGRYSPSKMPQKGILQQRVSVSSSPDTLPPPPAAGQRRRRLSSSLPAAYGPGMGSCETLPLIADAYRTAIPRLNRSTQDLRPEAALIPPGALPRPLRPNPNPTRKQRGLLRILNGADAASRIPLRSNWASMDDLTAEQRRRPSLAPLDMTAKRRRSSSTSPERRSSTQTVSDRRSSNLSTATSDFSFRRTSLTPQTQRRKSIAPSASPAAARRRKSVVAPGAGLSSVGNRTPRTRIAKASTLSPIIGTPNKDSSSPQSPSHVGERSSLAASETHSDTTSRRGSLSKIPVRSRADSRPESRSNSPLKDFSAQLLSGLSSGATSRSQSRNTVRYESQPGSRVTSRGPSRSTSRASTRAISRGPSRGSSRPGSRMDQAKELANSRSNSRMSVHSTTRAGSVSPTAGQQRAVTSPARRRRKSISLSPQTNRRPIGERRRSVSAASLVPPGGPRGRSRNAEKQLERRSSRSRIPRRTSSGGLVEATTSTSPTRRAPRNANERPAKTSPSPGRRSKEPASAKKAPASVRKPDSSVKRTAASVGKPAASAKKQPSNLQRSESSNLKRSTSNLKKGGPLAGQPAKREPSQTSLKAGGGSEPPAAKREASQGSLKKVGVAATVATTKPAVQRTASTKSVAGKSSATSKGGKDASKTKGGVGEKDGGRNGAGSGSATKAGGRSATATPTKSTTAAGGMSRQPSKMTLVRMGSRISLLGKKRGDTGSKLTSKISEETAADVKDSKAAGSAEAHADDGSASKGAGDSAASLSSSILEKTQKAVEQGSTTATHATDEIHKGVNETLTDLRGLEGDMGRTGSDSATSPTSSVATVIENRAGKKGVPGESVSRSGTAEGAATSAAANGSKGANHADGPQKSPQPPSQPIEAAVSVVNGGGGGGAAAPPPPSKDETGERNFEFGLNETSTAGGAAVDAGAVAGAASSTAATADDSSVDAIHAPDSVGSGEEAFKTDAKRRSPDGKGGSSAGSGKNTGSREFLKTTDDEDAGSAATKSRGGCCRCCARFCMPCRRSRCSRCCRRNKSRPLHDESEEPVLSATSSATTTNLEVIDETKAPAKDAKDKSKQASCWQKLMCCKRCTKRSTAMDEAPVMEAMAAQQMATVREEVAPPTAPPKQSKFGLCLSKVFCCRAVNKVDTTTGDETEVKKCCFCIPCRRKRSAATAPLDTASTAGSAAWQDPERGIVSTDASVLEGGSEAMPKEGCCKRFWSKVLCCRRKPVPRPSESRRASMKAPPPPAEDTRRKLHVDLVEYNSKMKGAIPVLPLYLAWFCAICNTVLPGLGTLLSGLFCICIGIPRFSQYDSAKARFGSFIINTIVGVAQLFCVLFCFVGWGWSIWWGTIMLRCARKLSKIKKVERLEMEEERRQAEMAATTAAATARVTAAAVTAEPEAAKA